MVLEPLALPSMGRLGINGKPQATELMNRNLNSSEILVDVDAHERLKEIVTKAVFCLGSHRETIESFTGNAATNTNSCVSFLNG